jgi:hypothetical protein
MVNLEKHYPRRKKPDIKGHFLYEMCRIGKFTETDSRLVVGRKVGTVGNWEVCGILRVVVKEMLWN